MYYTPDGKFAIVVAEQRERLNFLDAATMKLGTNPCGCLARAWITWISPPMAAT